MGVWTLASGIVFPLVAPGLLVRRAAAGSAPAPPAGHLIVLERLSRSHGVSILSVGRAQYMSSPTSMAPAFLFFSGISETRASVVRSREAMDEAFCSAVRTTLVGSMTPASTRSS